MIGGYSLGGLNTIYRYEPADETFVLMEDVSLRQESYLHSAMYVDAQALPKCD